MSAEPAIELPVPDEPVPFNLDLSDDQRDIRDWVHDFADDVVRPAASEWDEREETPWPIIQEAAKIGLYGFEALAQFCADPTGLTLPIVNEELFWGDAGIGMAIMGTALAVAGIFANGTPEQIGEWVPQCYGTPDDPKVARLLRLRARRRLRRLVAAHPRGLRRGQGRVGAQRHEGVDHQRRHRRRPRRRRLGRPRARLARPGRFVDPARAPRASRGHEGQEARHPRLAHRRGLPRRLRVPGSCLLGGKEKLDERLARAREGRRGKRQAAMPTFEATRPTVGAQALGIARAAYEYALDYAKERDAVRASRSSRTRRSPSRSPT